MPVMTSPVASDGGPRRCKRAACCWGKGQVQTNMLSALTREQTIKMTILVAVLAMKMTVLALKMTVFAMKVAECTDE